MYVMTGMILVIVSIQSVSLGLLILSTHTHAPNTEQTFTNFQQEKK